MTLKAMTEVHMGSLALRVFRSVESGKVFVAVDRLEENRRIRGPFFSESDVRRLVSLVEEHRPTRILEGLREMRWQARTDTGASRAPLYNLAVARAEIDDAIRRVHTEGPGKRASAITVVPPMPKFRYLHTCSICGSHVESVLRFGCSGSLRLCPFCQHVHAATE